MRSDIRMLSYKMRRKALDLKALLPRGNDRPATVTLDAETLWDIATAIDDVARDIEDLVDDIQDIIGR